MQYLSLYRKYRPRQFKEIIGQEHIIKILLNQIKNEKISHAYLFTGPRGVGKTSTARILAKAINCMSSQNGEPCNKCEACVSISNNSATDIIEIDGASNNSVSEIRSLREKALLSTAFLKRKIYIIDEIHMLTTAAFNALLKILEEPPMHVGFIFATTQIHKIPLTIVSRCQRFDFYTIWKEALEDHLKTVFNLENKIVEAEALKIMIQLAKGGVRDALGIAEQCISYSNENIVSDDVRKIYGILTDDELVYFLKSLISWDFGSIKNQINTFFRKGINMMHFILNILNFLKEKFYLNLTKNIDSFSFYDEAILKNIEIKNEIIIFLINLFRNLSKNLIYSENQHDLLEITCMEGSSWIKSQSFLPNETTIQTPPETITPDVSEPLKATPVVNKQDLIKEPKSAPAPPTMSQEINLSSAPYKTTDIANTLLSVDLDIRKKDTERWNYVTDYLQNRQYKRLAGLLVNGKIVASGEQFLILIVDHELTANSINGLINEDLAIKFIKTILGRVVLVIALSMDDWEKTKNVYLEKEKDKTLQKIDITKINVDFFLDFERINSIETTRNFDEATATDLEKFLNKEFKNEYEVK